MKAFLDEKVRQFDHPSFIENDPISVPHQYQLRQDQEIAGLFTAILSWGQRKTILKKANELMNLMDKSPYDFILNHKESDRRRFERFVHRTFQPADVLYFLEFLQSFLRDHASLEEAFFSEGTDNVKDALIHFHNVFFSLDKHLPRTKKHIATPAKNSTCKRLNMYLRWMVRSSHSGVDFGLWKGCKTKDLMIPLDIHVFNISRKLGLLKRDKTDWMSVVELTEQLRQFDADDPVKYDFALFGMGVLESSSRSYKYAIPTN